MSLGLLSLRLGGLIKLNAKILMEIVLRLLPLKE